MPPRLKRTPETVKSRDQRIASWVFCRFSYFFFIYFILCGPSYLPEPQMLVLEIFCAISCGLFGYLITGTIRVLKPRFIRAVGGMGPFVLVLWVWNHSLQHQHSMQITERQNSQSASTLSDEHLMGAKQSAKGKLLGEDLDSEVSELRLTRLVEKLDTAKVEIDELKKTFGTLIAGLPSDNIVKWLSIPGNMIAIDNPSGTSSMRIFSGDDGLSFATVPLRGKL